MTAGAAVTQPDWTAGGRTCFVLLASATRQKLNTNSAYNWSAQPYSDDLVLSCGLYFDDNHTSAWVDVIAGWNRHDSMEFVCLILGGFFAGDTNRLRC